MCTIGMATAGPVGNDCDRRVTDTPTAAVTNETSIIIEIRKYLLCRQRLSLPGFFSKLTFAHVDAYTELHGFPSY